MNRFLWVVSLGLLAGQSFASDLYFPTNQVEIERAFTGGGMALDESDWGDEKAVVKVGAKVNFAYNSAELLPKSRALLDEYGRALSRGLSDLDFYVVGHTDSEGGAAYNQTLSEQRAQSVVNYLVTLHGVADDRLTVRGKGESQPIESNATASGRGLNRRVEFIKVW